MSILHVVAPAPFGGLEGVVQSLAAGHAAAGHRVDVAALLDEKEGCDHPFLEPLMRSGVGVHAVSLPARAYGRERRALRRLCEQLRPDVVHTHGYRPDVVDAPVARSLGIPTVSTVHGFTGGDWKNRVYEWLQQRSHRRFDAVVVVSRAMERAMVARGAPSGLRCIPNAWADRIRPLSRSAARQALGIRDDAFVVGWVGRLSREKGPDVLLEAVAKLDGADPMAACMIGGGPELDRLTRLIQSRGLDRRVLLTGPAPDAARLFPAFDVFALSSRTEGTPLVLFEAMSCGVPIVATRVGGVPDVVSAGQSWLVEPDDADALAAALDAVRRDPAMARVRAASAAARLRERYAVEPWLREYEDLYRDVVEAHRLAGSS